MRPLSLYVCPASKLPQTLRASGAKSLVSLLRADEFLARPDSIQSENYLRLDMSDISTPLYGHMLPSADHLARLVAFVGERNGPVVLHCFAGVSRSTAAAFVLACAFAPHLPEAEIASSLRRLSPTATPNSLVVRLGDDLLGREGRMIAAVAAIGRGAECFEGVPFRLDLD